MKSLTGCTKQKTFEASKEYLPSAFNDGTTGSPVLNNDKQVMHIKTVIPDSYVEISLRYVATRILIRRISGYLSFSIKIPEEVIEQSGSISSLQLCVTGCPVSQRIGYKEVLAYPEYFIRTLAGSDDETGRDVQPAMLRQEAEDACRAAGVTDFYFDSCVFDLLLTGDKKLTSAAAAAQEDVHILYPPYRRHFETNRTSLTLYETLGQAALSKDASQQFKRLSPKPPEPSASSKSFRLDISSFLLVLCAVFSTRCSLISLR